MRMTRQGRTDERWLFYQDTAERWKWARLDLLGTVMDQCHRTFASRSACVADARRCGYKGVRPEARGASTTAIT
jgi:hypothetical protein